MCGYNLRHCPEFCLLCIDIYSQYIIVAYLFKSLIVFTSFTHEFIYETKICFNCAIIILSIAPMSAANIRNTAYKQ